MNNLDKRIEQKREALNTAIKNLGVLDKHTIMLSQQLDKLIVNRMRHSFYVEGRRTNWIKSTI
jgi:hypothetical protein